MPLNTRLTVDQLQLLTDEFTSRNHAMAEAFTRLSSRLGSIRADLHDLQMNISAGLLGVESQHRGILERRLSANMVHINGTMDTISVVHTYLNSVNTLLAGFENNRSQGQAARSAERIRKSAILELVERFQFADLKPEEVVGVVKAAAAREANNEELTDAERSNEELRYVGILVRQLMTGRE